MNVGWVGLGKLGLPCALVLAQHHKVWGYDESDRPWKIVYGHLAPNREEGLGKLLDDPGHRIGRSDSVSDLVQNADIVFVAVQTPHEERFGGEKPMPEWETADFDYTWLVQACREVCQAAQAQRRDITLVVVSTVLPGTVNRVVRPLLNAYVRLVYSPQFIAMGTTVADFSDPEFVICGSDDNGWAMEQLAAVFYPLHGEDRLFYTDIITAESIKVLYNTFISMKIVWANHVMELAHKTGSDCDKVVDALEKATDRVVSPRYMRGGMGDGGACHPRDLMAMSWLEDKHDMSADLFGYLARAREKQTQWLARLVRHYAYMAGGARVVILGQAYKPGSDLTAGSPALLLAHYLADLSPFVCDTYVGGSSRIPGSSRPLVYVIATRHPEYPKYPFQVGSFVIDPFGYIPDRPGLTVVRVGRR